MITGVGFCPHPPLLVPEVAQAAAPELDDLRKACRTAITRIAAPDTQLVVLGPGAASASHEARARGSFAGFGVPLEVPLGSDEPGPVDLPLSLAVGAWLLRDALGPDCGAVGYSIGSDGGAVPLFDAESPVALLVMGDGSARRSTSAPGYFDERAEAFDARVAEVLRAGDADGLRIDLGPADELLASGAPAWTATAGLLDGAAFDAELLYEGAPYGVGYFVAIWTNRG